MKRGRRRHWGLVLLAALITASPESARLRAREALLEVFGRFARLVASPAEAAEAPGENPEAARFAREVRRLEAENEKLKLALQQAGAVPEAIAQGAVSLVPVDAQPLTAGTSIQRRLLLSAGRNLGIARGQAALVGTSLVGVVVQVSARAAELRLVTDPGFRIRGALKGREVEGLVRGRAGDSLTLEVVADAEATEPVEIALGEEVMTSPKSSLCPLPSLLGRVVAIERMGALTRCELAPALDGRALEGVVVLRPASEGG